MRDNELDGVFDRCPDKPHMVFLDMTSGTGEEIFDEICQDIDGGFAKREWRYIFVLDMSGR